MDSRLNLYNISNKIIGFPKIPYYIHIPKTGGTYLGQRESSQKPVISPLIYGGHIYVITKKGNINEIYFKKENSKSMVILKNKLKNKIVFSTVRNPFSWLVSYAAHAGGWNPKYYDTEHYDFKVANKGFDYLVKTIADREDIWPNRKFIHCQLFADDGDLMVDWINFNEVLDKDLEDFSKCYKVKFRKKTKQRIGKHKDYREYYTDSLIDLVYDTWKREFDLFGYNFDGFDEKKKILRKKVKNKDNIKYYLEKDLLVIDNKLIKRKK